MTCYATVQPSVLFLQLSRKPQIFRTTSFECRKPVRRHRSFDIGYVDSRELRWYDADMRFVKKFTPFFSPNFNSFGVKNTKNEWKWRHVHHWQKFYTAAGSDSSDKSHLWSDDWRLRYSFQVSSSLGKWQLLLLGLMPASMRLRKE